MLVLEKATGQVQRVVNGAVQSTVLDLAVNFGSERGLLGIALHPDFPANPGVYLYWTESTTGADTTVLSATPLLGNRVDRFVWNGSALTFDRNLIRLRAIQQDAGQAASAATTTAACSLRRRREALRLHRRRRPARPAAEPACADQRRRARPDRARRPVRRAAAGQRPPHRRRPPAQRRRHRPVGQPVLRGRSGDGRRSRRQHPEDLLLRPPQQLRHGCRSAFGRTVAAGERRRLASASSTSSSPA